MLCGTAEVCPYSEQRPARRESPMTAHILMTYAARRPYRDIPIMPPDAQYDTARGYWVLSGMPMVSSPDFADGGCTGKKCDQETGEDLKGE